MLAPPLPAATSKVDACANSNLGCRWNQKRRVVSLEPKTPRCAYQKALRVESLKQQKLDVICQCSAKTTVSQTNCHEVDHLPLKVEHKSQAADTFLWQDIRKPGLFVNFKAIVAEDAQQGSKARVETGAFKASLEDVYNVTVMLCAAGGLFECINWRIRDL